MHEVIISFQKEDQKLKNEIEKYFNDNVEFVEISPFDAMNDVIMAIIPIASLTVQVIDFFKTHLAKNENSSNKRVIVSKSGEIDLTGYSGDEVEKILKAIFEDK